MVLCAAMSSTFTGFSEEDLQRIKSVETDTNINSAPTNIRKSQIGVKPKRAANQYKLQHDKQSSYEAIDRAVDTVFDKCRLSIKNKSVCEDNINNNDLSDIDTISSASSVDLNGLENRQTHSIEDTEGNPVEEEESNRKSSTDFAPDLVRSVDNYTEDGLVAHSVKIGELQLKQKIMEEQNKKRKEMLAKALADRTKQTEEEVLRLEKIKKELQLLDGQFSQDVSVLRKKIDQACLCYAEAEKHYLKVEKEFLQAKINLQKEKEKKELLTEHLCALITHNETRKAQKLETLMLELARDRKGSKGDVSVPLPTPVEDDDEAPVIVDGVCQKTGKMV